MATGLSLAQCWIGRPVRTRDRECGHIIGFSDNASDETTVVVQLTWDHDEWSVDEDRLSSFDPPIRIIHPKNLKNLNEIV